MNTVTVVGSINLDRTIRVQKMPRAGETIHTKELFTAHGGKGANQAVAAQRLGAQTNFIGAVGDDAAGQDILAQLKKEGLQTKGIQVLPQVATGQAYVVVDDAGENQIMIHGGANQEFTPEQVRSQAQLIADSDFVIAQFESPLECTQAAFELAHEHGAVTILNPAPAQADLSPKLLELTDLIIPNETEAQILTGVAVVDQESAEQAAQKLQAKGIEQVIITLGSRGAFWSASGQASQLIPAYRVEAVDTTAAGDTFIGALASFLDPQLTKMVAAIKFGNQASALTVQRPGAQSSIPYRTELEKK
ncbi:ribokinase [Lactobacillus sp. DCY120]|uniref:Ribokinase n=1 Tax=Bombilactobacillus apium TaxID=2675299 RepID=A0A850R3L5_9LACO|nr:ribokinase [Bombilactobacillus apium]NVY96561.1 ribokinase [Bombilactobacillus apium]